MDNEKFDENIRKSYQEQQSISKSSWYGCVIQDNKGRPILFPFNRMGYAMDGAEIIDDEGFYKKNLNPTSLSVVKCHFLKENEILSPEQAVEDHYYQDLSFQIEDLEIYDIVNQRDFEFQSLWEMRSQDNSSFILTLKNTLNNYIEENDDNKSYLGFIILQNGEKTLFVMDKLGFLYPSFIFQQDSSVEEVVTQPDEAIVVQVEFADGTMPIKIDEANSRIGREKDCIFISAKNLGRVVLKEEFGPSWESVLNSENKEDALQTLKTTMYAISSANKK